MHYELIFDVSQAGFRHWTFPAYGLAFVAIGVLLLKYRANVPDIFRVPMNPKDATKLACFVLAVGLVWTTVAGVVGARDYFGLRRALDEGTVDLVEGRVENFVSIPDKNERFSVCGTAFSYSDHVATAGFNTTNSRGGPIRAGSWVRVAHIGNRIARLEIAQGTVDPGTACLPSHRRQ